MTHGPVRRPIVSSHLLEILRVLSVSLFVCPSAGFSTLLALYATVCATARCPSICLSHLSAVATACGGFAAVGPAGRRYRSIAARRVCRDIDRSVQQGRQHGTQQQMRAVSRFQLT